MRHVTSGALLLDDDSKLLPTFLCSPTFLRLRSTVQSISKMSSKSNSLPAEARIPEHEDEDESQSEAKDVEGQAATTSRDQHHHDLPSSALSTATKASSAAAAADPSDQGHRYGNFHNYYAFHPPSARMDAMKDIVDYIGSSWTPSRPEKQPKLHDGNSSNGPFQQSASTLLRNTPFTYLDVGCNEGDLTMGVAHALQVKLETTVDVTGVDIDGVLIDRANQKYNRQDVPSESSSSAVVTARFHVADACSTDQLQQVTTSSSQPPTNNEDGMGMFDLVSLFSTTMWIHVHAGDEGLTQVLQQLCHKARHFFIVEPQPSKWYVAFW